MPMFKVTHVQEQTRPWESTKGGPMVSYRITLRDANGDEHPNVEWARKASSAPPKVDEVLDGTLDTTGQYGPKFKSTPSASFGGGGGSRGKDPKERAEIRRQNAQAQALRYMEIKVGLGLIKDFKPSELVPVIEFFYADSGNAA